MGTCEYYLKSGCQVGVCGRDLKKLPVISQSFIGKGLKCYEVDVTDREALKEAIESFSQGAIDVLVANAGISQGDKSSCPQFSVARDILRTNLDGFLNTFEVGFEIMKKRGQGQLVGVASVAGMVGLPGAAAYCGSKGALLKMCESFSIDLKKFGIDVMAIAPGFIDTPLTRKNKHPMPFLMDSKKAAVKMAKAPKKEPLYVFPLRMKLLMILLEKMPRSLYRFIMSFSRFAYPNHYEKGNQK